MIGCERCLGPLRENGLCPSGERARAERAAQGLPPTVEDPAALAALAVLFGDSLDRGEPQCGPED